MINCCTVNIDNDTIEIKIIKILFLIIYSSYNNLDYYLPEIDFDFFRVTSNNNEINQFVVDLDYNYFKYINKFNNIIEPLLNIEKKLIYWNKYHSIFNKTFLIDVYLEDEYKIFYKKIINNFDLTNYMVFILADDNEDVRIFLGELNFNNYYFISDLTKDKIEQIVFMSLIDVKCCYKSKLILLANYINELYNMNNKLMISNLLLEEINLRKE